MQRSLLAHACQVGDRVLAVPWSTDGFSHLSNKKLAEKAVIALLSVSTCNELTKRVESGSLNETYAQLAFSNILFSIQVKTPSNVFHNTKAPIGYISVAKLMGLLPEKSATKIWDCVYNPMGKLHHCQKLRLEKTS